jgi:hypothetical protein
MKKLSLVFSLFVAISTMAQTTQDDVEMIRRIYGKAKKDMIGNYMKVSADKSEAFWKVYDEYEAERKILSEKRTQLIGSYAENYNQLDDLKADELATQTLKNNLDYDKLNTRYYKKMKKVLGGLEAAKFMQVENYLQTSIRSEVQEAIPFIGELDKSRKQ